MWTNCVRTSSLFVQTIKILWPSQPHIAPKDSVRAHTVPKGHVKALASTSVGQMLEKSRGPPGKAAPEGPFFQAAKGSVSQTFLIL